MLAHLTRAKLQKLACAHTLLHTIFACARGIANIRDTQEDAHHKFALGLPHYTYGVTTGTVAVGNEM